MTKPITPTEATTAREILATSDIPPTVIEVFNELIVEYLDGFGRARIEQMVAANRVAARLGMTRREVYDRHWLDVEPVFEEAGWKVRYYKQPYFEVNDDSFFLFEKP